jgi:hypothetical protein
MLVIDNGLHTDDACVVVMDVAAMGMAIDPIVEFLDWGRRVCGALGGIAATAAIEGHAAALVIPPTIAVDSVESVFPAAFVGATTATAGLSLLDMVLLLATLATVCLTTLVGLL